MVAKLELLPRRAAPNAKTLRNMPARAPPNSRPGIDSRAVPAFAEIAPPCHAWFDVSFDPRIVT